jgi:hypothetical protein
MSDFKDAILARAFKIIPGMAYNQVRQDMSESAETIFYEIVLPVEGSWDSFRDRIYPAFVRYLKSKSIDPESPSRVTVAAFFKDKCYLIDGRRFLEALMELEGLSQSALHFRILRWLKG